MSRYSKLIGFVVTIALATTIFAQGGPPLCAELVQTGFGLIGDTLYPGTPEELILDGFVQGHSALLDIDPGCIRTGADYRYFRTPYAETVPDFATDWIPLPYENIDGGGDGDIYLYTAGIKIESDSAYSLQELWLMHDWHYPSAVTDLDYMGEDSLPAITLTWGRSFDSASGVYKYYIYRADDWTELQYIDPMTMTPHDSVPDIGAAGYAWTDRHVAAHDAFWYAVVPIDKAGWMPRHDPPRIQGHASDAPPDMPVCSFLKPTPRYHTGSGIWIYIDHSLCPGRADVEYQYRRYFVWRDSLGLHHGDFITTAWTDADSFWFPTVPCSTYSFSARAREIDSYTTNWAHTSPYFPLTTNDPEPPGCPDTIYAVSEGVDGIHIYFTHDETNDCGSGTQGYLLYRIPEDNLSSVIDNGTNPAIGWETALGDTLWHYLVGSDTGGWFEYLDRDVLDNVTYYYLVCPYDSAGNVNWFDCGDDQVDTATGDMGVGAPVPVEFELPYAADSTIVANFIDTTRCDAVEVEFEWAPDMYFSYGLNHIGPILINDAVDIPGYYKYENPDDGDCTDDDSLELTIYGLHETYWYIRARFIDENSNVSDWSAPLLCARIDNTPPTTSSVLSVQSLADSVNRVDVLIKWNPAVIDDEGVGVEGVNIYRSNAVGALGSVIATVSRHDSMFLDTDPDPGNNWHDNVYTIAPFDYLGHENISGGQGSFPVIYGDIDRSPPTVPEIVSVSVGHYLDEFTICWEDTGPNALSNRYTLRHAGDFGWVWLGDPLLAPNIELGSSITHCETFPIEFFAGSDSLHYFTMFASDSRTPANQSGWSEVFEFVIPENIFQEYIFHLIAGWNFISLPVRPANPRADVIFPGLLEAFEWNPTTELFDPVEVLEPGHAYLILVSGTADYGITGIPVTQVEFDDIGPGWWTVGAPFDTGAGSGYEYTGPGFGVTYSYDDITEEYSDTNILYKGEGYWLLLSQIGDFYSESDMSPGSRKAIPDNFDIDWSFAVDADGVPLEFVSSPNSEPGLDRADLVLPPTPPHAELSAYIKAEDGFRYSRSARPDAEWTLVLPINTRLTWSPDDLPEIGLVLTCGGKTIDMHASGSAVLSGEAKIIAGEKLPTEFALGLTRPNPFNPACEIPFALPENSRVSLKIFDLNGRCVATILDNEMPAGEHTAEWCGKGDDGYEMSAGIYFCRMETESFTATRRMLLVK
ncbi:hypothetical protein DRQ36_01470 [bacterium]|nr:MAG: hypothetical protein DRQ36_01470 [bacterium]